MGEFSLPHLLILVLILLIFFGPSRLPALGQSLGKAIKGFKDGLNEVNIEAKPVPPQAEAPVKEVLQTPANAIEEVKTEVKKETQS